MNRPTIHLGVKHWDHLTPLALGDVQSEHFEFRVHRLDKTPVLKDVPGIDGGETSLSRVVIDQTLGDPDVPVPLPAFLYSAFRHRCILVRRDSPLTDLKELSGARIGLTGWPDTGNTWTRALLREIGVGVDDATWVVGPVADGEGNDGRLGPYGHPANVSLAPDGRTITAMLLDGELDAMMTPQMPAGFHLPESPLRRLLPDYRTEEVGYASRTGFVPGIHVMTVRRDVLERHPLLGAELVDVLRRSYQVWMARRVAALDTTPWLLDEIEALAATLGLGWNPHNPPYATGMIAALCEEIHAQRLIDRKPDAASVFAVYEGTRPAP